MQDAFAAPLFRAERMVASVRTDPAVVERLLPPPLRPLEDPIVNVEIGRRTSTVGLFTIGTLWIPARLDDQHGHYILAMIVDRFDPAQVYGREVLGEPKKIGTVQFVKERSGDRLVYHGYVERFGVRLINLTLEVDAVTPAEPTEGTGDIGADLSGTVFCTKAQVSHTGRGLQGDGLLIGSSGAQVRVYERNLGVASVELKGTVHDPFDEIVVREVLGGSYSVEEMDLATTTRTILATIAEKEFTPYHYGQLDDYGALNSLLLPALSQPLAQ
jgi:hypothetical protein